MERGIIKIIAWIVAFSMVLIMSGCGTVTSSLPSGNTKGETGSEGTMVTEEATTEEPTTEDSTTEESTTEEVTTEEPTTAELPTRESTPYDEVLDEYFATWEQMYTTEESTEFNSDEWEYIQDWKKRLNIRVVSAEVIYSVEEVLSENDTEVRLYVETGA